MSSRRLIVTAALAASACAGNGRVRALETRLAAVEDQAKRNDAELRATLVRIEAQLASLVVTVAAGDDRDALDARLEAISQRLDKLAAARPPARPARREPDPAKVYAVPVDGDPVRGKADALVTIVKATEYACPFCEKNRAVLDQIVADYPNDVRIVYKDFVVHPQTATAAAQAGCAAHLQGKFLEMDHQLWERAFKDRRFEPAFYETLAGEIGLDVARFRADMNGVCVAEVQQDIAALTMVGVNATPGFFINGRFLSGAQPYPAFKALIDEELAKARDRVKKGAKKKKYYDEWVIKPGLTKLEPPPAAPAP